MGNICGYPTFDTKLVAPCGLNCAVCRAFMRKRNPCPGCRVDGRNKSNACVACSMVIIMKK